MRSRVYRLPPDGPTIGSAADVVELIYGEHADGAEWLAVPVARVDPAFFELRSGLAGEIAQTCANYRIGLAVVGDVTGYIAQSQALSAYVTESNRGRHVWFVADDDELRSRLGE